MDVIDNRVDSRFELVTDAGPAFAAYEREGDVVTFTHTVVPPEAEGHGVGSKLIAGALAQVKGEGLKIVPACAFVKAYVERHPEWRDLVAAPSPRA